MRWYAVPAGLGGLGVAVLGYASLYERNQWTLRRFDVPVLPPGQESLTVLHLSDIHMLARQRGKRHWLRALAALEPDLVVNTGDNLAGTTPYRPWWRPSGRCWIARVPSSRGSNDYYAPNAEESAPILVPGRQADRRGTAAVAGAARHHDRPRLGGPEQPAR
ncbi:MAG: metallophosphoesterase [Geodermatophilaceae bacterium]